MNQQDFKRKLSAILSADVKGYSKLMRSDEEATVITLNRYRAIITEVVIKFNGRVVDSPGDNLLAEFESVVNAVRSGFDIQTKLEYENAKLPNDRKMLFRIGINLGDVIQDGDRIYGDGVNVAARMESLAEAGGISVSGSVYEQIESKLEFACEYLGEQEVKNISTPIRVYRLSGDAAGQDCTYKPKDRDMPRRTVLSLALIILMVIAGAWWFSSYLLYSETSSKKSAAINQISDTQSSRLPVAVFPVSSGGSAPNRDSLDGKNDSLYFIDAHSQVDYRVGDAADLVLEKMLANNVALTMLSTRGERRQRDILIWGRKNPEKIAPLLRSKGKHYLNNTPAYYESIRMQLEVEKFIGAAAILVYHAQKEQIAPEVRVALTDERVSFLLKESLSRNWPVIFHIEFASLHGRERQQHMEGLKDLLEQYPRHAFALIHMGQLPPKEVRELIDRHPNIYFLTSHTDPVTAKISRQPWLNIFTLAGDEFQESWKALFIAYPDRFIFALDNVRYHHWQGLYDEKMERWKKALSGLPQQTAHLIAHGNAERLWNLK